MTEKNSLTEPKVVATHRKASFEYEILEKFEAGLVLKGSEVKSMREGKVTLNEAYASFHQGELYLFQCNVQPYSKAGPYFQHDPIRKKKLLLREEELRRLRGKTEEKGLTLVPLRLYFNARGKAKLALALGRGKKTFDKRETIKKREMQRDLQRVLKNIKQ